jgi:glutathione S-transferase
LNTHIGQARIFISGMNISAADIILFAHIAKYFSALPDFEKINLPHTFRWIDHMQHLPGMLEQIKNKSLFTTFPDESAEGPSKA